MPYYTWTGITLTAAILKGSHFARSQSALEQFLFAQDIALLTAHQHTWRPVFFYPINASQKADFFSQLATLLQADVHLHVALRTLAAQGGPQRFSEVIENLADDVEQGAVLSDALAKQSTIFDQIMITLCAIGQASNLPTTLTLLSTLLLEQQAHKKKLQSALSMPLITFAFFIAIMLGMFTIVIPHFAGILSSLKTELPPVTQALFFISNALLSPSGACWGLLLVFISIALVYFKRSHQGKNIYNTITFYTPYIRTFTHYRNYMLFFNSLGTMVQAGVPLTDALTLAATVITNNRIRENCQAIIENVHNGKALSVALEQIPSIPTSVKALVAVGEQTGNLGVLLVQAGVYCEQRLNGRLAFFTIIIQPLLLLLLAGCVITLMLALYLPILSLSNSIQ